MIDQDTVTESVQEVSSDSEKEKLSKVAQALVSDALNVVQQAVETDILSIPDEDEMQDEMTALLSSLVSTEEPRGFRPGMCNISWGLFGGKVNLKPSQR